MRRLPSRARLIAGMARGAGRIALVFAALTLTFCGPGRSAPHRELWFYYSVNLAQDEEVATLESIWRRASKAGYSRVVLTDAKFARLGEMDEHYLANLKRVKTLAEEIGLDVLPAIFQVGRSNSMLAHDPNLAEGLPVRNALFVVRGGEARPVTDPPVTLGPVPSFKDGSVTLADGVVDMRSSSGRARFLFRKRVQPYRVYHLSVQIRTEQFSGRPQIEVLGNGRSLSFLRSLSIPENQDWTTYHAVFNSLDRPELEIWMGLWKSASGRLAWKDWKLEEAGLVNVLRRDGAPCVVKGYVEGKDYEPIRDGRLGKVPWRGQYEAWHDAPPIKTRLPDGTRLRVSWYEPAVIYNGQVMCCISEPAVMNLLRDEFERVRAAWGAHGYLMLHDEIRSMNWDPTCQRRQLTPGQLLADHMRQCTGLLGGATGFVWSDMFDPKQNAIADYYLVNGTLAGSWAGLDSSVVVVNWNAGNREESLRFFAKRGHKQVISAYFDGKPEEVRDWIHSAQGVPGVLALMYTTWQQRYDDLEEFARICRAAE